jgi:hypothetical protein
MEQEGYDHCEDFVSMFLSEHGAWRADRLRR